jgi:hypothetical protein
MKVFVIGGTTVSPDDDKYPKELRVLERSMRQFGEGLIGVKHELLVCSPYPGSADLEAVRGAAGSAHARKGTNIEFHHPHINSVSEEVDHLKEMLNLGKAKSFFHLPPVDATAEALKYAWLLAQLSAMDRSHVVVAIGGKVTGAASLLLPLAEEKRKEILPFTFLGGAAEQSFFRQQYALEDRLAQGVAILNDLGRIDEAVSMLNGLAHPQTATEQGKIRRFFISYPRSRPQEADFIEMILRRRNQIVFRDEQDFGSGQPIPAEIDQHLYQADVFVAIWCKEYACSPWCFDELDLALKRHKEGRLTLWLLCVDDTRVVPPAARDLLNYTIGSRKELEGTILKLLGSATSSRGRGRRSSRTGDG